ncbi:nuclear transport factor 2 family protein [Janthinobacterium lividum]|nr:nuclear transport factor 2 family protein [Janthinobacterium lividum]
MAYDANSRLERKIFSCEDLRLAKGLINQTKGGLTMATVPDIISRFLGAVNERDAVKLGVCFTPDGQYFLKFPDPAMVGREVIRDYFGAFFPKTSKAKWDVISCGVDGDTVYVERQLCTGLPALSGTRGRRQLIRRRKGRLDCLRPL